MRAIIIGFQVCGWLHQALEYTGLRAIGVSMVVFTFSIPVIGGQKLAFMAASTMVMVITAEVFAAEDGPAIVSGTILPYGM